MARRKPGSGEAEAERRERQDEPAIPGSDRIDAATEARLMEVAGFTRAELYERRGALSRRGLVSFLEPGDKILEVAADHVRIRRKEGPVQTFWNLRRPPAWLRPIGDETGLAGDPDE